MSTEDRDKRSGETRKNLSDQKIGASESAAGHADSFEAKTAIQNAPDTEPTRIFSDNNSSEEVTATPAARHYGWRFVLVCLFCVMMAVTTGLGISQLGLYGYYYPFTVFPDGESLKVYGVNPANEDKIIVGDEMLSLNGRETPAFAHFLAAVEQLRPGESYTAVVRRDGQLIEAGFFLEPHSWTRRVSDFIHITLFPVMFFVVGLVVLVLKPNDKQALLFALAFANFAATLPKEIASFPLILGFAAVLGFAAKSFFAVFFLHFFLIFPERSPLLRRFPSIEYLIYLPALLIGLPGNSMPALHSTGWFETVNLNPPEWLLTTATVTDLSYIGASFAALIVSYLRADTNERRKVRIVFATFLFAMIALLSIPFTWLAFPGWRQNFGMPYEDWVELLAPLPSLLIPFAFAYAIVRHRVIPVSFVVRRASQYLLAKNALRLLLILPVVGIVWNIAANPNRTVSEILFQNSSWFYFFIVVGIVDFILMRSRLNEWIDKKFFREQYDQERLLHRLIDDVKQSDSMAKLSRLVSSRVQSAIHPESIHLFYEDRGDTGDFSTGFTLSARGGSTVGASVPDKLAADSPLLRFMQTRRGAVEFPSGDTDELPAREITWLRSIGANLLVPMHGTDGKLAGFFSLGEKMSQIPYTGRDKELLETLANQIALVQENLTLKDRMRREQQIKTEVLSRFDEGNINLLKECPKCGKCFDRDAERCDVDGGELTFSLPVERTIEDRYRLEKLIGKGGMGAVYEAADTRINRRVAVKILSGAMFGNRDALRRFEREAQTAGRLQHHNIVTVFDYGVLSTEGAYLVMELIAGESLREVLDRESTLDEKCVVDWFGQVLHGLGAAHAEGIIHRDLKPENILIARDGRVRILDFGLARLAEIESPAQNVTVPGMIMGTLGYMPPEQLRGEKTDKRSDLFSVGVMIYEAVNGEKPFAGATYHEILDSMKSKSFANGDLGAEFFAVALAKRPSDRFTSAVMMRENLSTLSAWRMSL